MSLTLETVTMDDVLARTVKDGRCLIWTGHANAGRYPQWRIEKKLYAARRVVWQIAHGEIPDGMQIGVNCPNELCVGPLCLVCRSKSAAAPDHIKPDARMRIALKRRARSSLTIETVREIRASEEPANVLDARYGLTPGYSSRIRTGRVWREYSSPFAGLGARA